MVNTKLYQHKRKKINKIKKNVKEKFHKQLSVFLKSKNLNLKKKHPNKSIKPASIKKEKEEETGFINFIKKSLMFGKDKEDPKKKSLKKEKSMSKIDVENLFKNLSEEPNNRSSSSISLENEINNLKNPKKKRKQLEEKRAMNELSLEDLSEEKRKESPIPPIKKKISNDSSRLRATSVNELGNSQTIYDYESYIIHQKKIDSNNFDISNSQLKRDLLKKSKMMSFGNYSTPQSAYKFNKPDGNFI